jgi:hypothetical protein
VASRLGANLERISPCRTREIFQPRLASPALDTRRSFPYSLMRKYFPSFMKHSRTAGDQKVFAEAERQPTGER